MELAPFGPAGHLKHLVANHGLLQMELAPFGSRHHPKPLVALRQRPQTELAPFGPARQTPTNSKGAGTETDPDANNQPNQSSQPNPTYPFTAPAATPSTMCFCAAM